jgi:DNA-binding response OmpR family regulator
MEQKNAHGLRTRIRAVKKRRSQVTIGVLKIKDVELDPRLKRVNHNGKEVQLSPKENIILEYLFQNPDVYYTCYSLYDAIASAEADSSEELVRLHMKTLRLKLLTIDCENLVKTVHGERYIIESV